MFIINVKDIDCIKIIKLDINGDFIMVNKNERVIFIKRINLNVIFSIYFN